MSVVVIVCAAHDEPRQLATMRRGTGVFGEGSPYDAGWVSEGYAPGLAGALFYGGRPLPPGWALDPDISMKDVVTWVSLCCPDCGASLPPVDQERLNTALDALAGHGVDRAGLHDLRNELEGMPDGL